MSSTRASRGSRGTGTPAPADLVGGELGLRDVEGVGELDLGEIGGVAGLGDALAEGLERDTFVGGHGRGRRDPVQMACQA